jgi:SAM-dependent methyltransferase
VFKNPEESHEHSRGVLDMLYQYDSFLDSIKVVADMGCGSGRDTQWWAELMTRDDPPEPHNYLVYAVDKNTSKVEKTVLAKNKNIILLQEDYNTVHLPKKADLVWSHDSFQFSLNPLQTLSHWNRYMNVNGMLVLSVPVHTTYSYDRLQTRSFSGCYHTFNICNLMYMLAVNGFDCRDCYIYSAPNYGWIHFAVYKSYEPFDHATTSWFDLAEKNLISDSAMNSLNKYGHVRQEDLMFTWLDKDWRFAKN